MKTINLVKYLYHNLKQENNAISNFDYVLGFDESKKYNRLNSIYSEHLSSDKQDVAKFNKPLKIIGALGNDRFLELDAYANITMDNRYGQRQVEFNFLDMGNTTTKLGEIAGYAKKGSTVTVRFLLSNIEERVYSNSFKVNETFPVCQIEWESDNHDFKTQYSMKTLDNKQKFELIEETVIEAKPGVEVKDADMPETFTEGTNSVVTECPFVDYHYYKDEINYLNNQLDNGMSPE